MPNHNHSIATTNTALTGHADTASQQFDSTTASGVFSLETITTHRNNGCDWAPNCIRLRFNGNHSHTTTIQSIGGGSVHNNIAPYLSVNIWKRIS